MTIFQDYNIASAALVAELANDQLSYFPMEGIQELIRKLKVNFDYVDRRELGLIAREEQDMKEIQALITKIKFGNFQSKDELLHVQSKEHQLLKRFVAQGPKELTSPHVKEDKRKNGINLVHSFIQFEEHQLLKTLEKVWTVGDSRDINSFNNKL